VAPQRSVDRDTGMRRISTTTRWLAGIGVGLVGALSLFFASRAPSGSSATPTPATAPVTTPATTPAITAVGSTATVPTAPPTTMPPVTYPPSRHTTSRSS
jgi:hypothetical protein